MRLIMDIDSSKEDDDDENFVALDTDLQYQNNGLKTGGGKGNSSKANTSTKASIEEERKGGAQF